MTVSKGESALRVTRADGTLVFFAPVTTGSEKDPLPPGDWKVNGVSWRPTFKYNPNLFWDAKPGDGKATLQPGPNNPVGIVWIDINVDHYGIHGTPEPGRVGHRPRRQLAAVASRALGPIGIDRHPIEVVAMIERGNECFPLGLQIGPIIGEHAAEASR